MRRLAITILSTMLGLACAAKEPKEEAAAVATPRLELALPAGVAVTVDGEARGTTPLGLDLTAGAHALGLATPCATAELEITAVGGQTTRIERSDVPALGFATLRVTARDLEGKALVHALSLDGEVVERGQSSEVTVSACGHRIDVASEGLGGWSEQIAFAADAVEIREITLSLGPDMVRIPGGHFRMGPPGPSRYIPGLQETEDLEPHEREGWPWVHTLEVDVPTIDMDRTEVTAAQFHACRSGKCPWEAMRLSYTQRPDEKTKGLCTTDGRQFRKPLPGKENHPINCIARWEAETYCASVGKRLPTDAEWEYAARGGREDYYCPWGPLSKMEEEGRGNCLKGRDDEQTEPVCSHPDENSLHGLCDMVSNVSEYVTWTKGRWAYPFGAEVADYNGVVSIVVRGGGGAAFEDYFSSLQEEAAEVGFRCVRDLTTTEVDRGN